METFSPKCEGGSHIGGACVYVAVMLEQISKEWCVRVRSGFIRLSIKTGGGLL
jgi:hypothetical protein